MVEENRDNNSCKFIAWALTRATAEGTKQVDGCWNILNFVVLPLHQYILLTLLLSATPGGLAAYIFHSKAVGRLATPAISKGQRSEHSHSVHC
jgi:hypothetical protein